MHDKISLEFKQCVSPWGEIGMHAAAVQGNFWWLYLIPVMDSGRTQSPRPCPLGCSSRSAWWCAEQGAGSMCLLTTICSRTLSGQTQPCPLGREVNTSITFQYSTWEDGHNLKWCVMCDTYRHSGSWQRLTWSLVYTCTCNFLWCWDIQHSYRSQATGTHWYLWNTQYVSHVQYILIMEISWSCVFPISDLFRTPNEPYKYRYQIWRAAFHIECSGISRWQTNGDDVRL